MTTPTLKAYVLTYVSCLASYAGSFAITAALTYHTFRDLFPSAGDLKTYQEAAAAQGLLAILGAIIFSVILFQIFVLIFSTITLRLTLKNIGPRRRATIIWICILLLLNPIILYFDFNTGLSLMVIGAWLLIVPGIGRFLATARH